MITRRPSANCAIVSSRTVVPASGNLRSGRTPKRAQLEKPEAGGCVELETPTVSVDDHATEASAPSSVPSSTDVVERCLVYIGDDDVYIELG